MLTLPRMRHSALQQQPCGGASRKTVSGDRFLLFFLLWASTLGVSLIYWPPEVSTNIQFSSVQSLSRVRLCDPMNCSRPGLPVHHQLPEFTQTHVHRVGDAIQPSPPLVSLVAQMVKASACSVGDLGWEDPLKKEMATHSITLAWKIPWMKEPGRVHGVSKSRTRLSDFTFFLFFLSSPHLDAL